MAALVNGIVLIIDADTLAANRVGGFFESLNHRVVVMDNANAALNCLETQSSRLSYDMVVLNHVPELHAQSGQPIMNTMSSVQFINRTSRLFEPVFRPVIALQVDPADFPTIQSLAAPDILPDQYIKKPVELSDVVVGARGIMHRRERIETYSRINSLTHTIDQLSHSSSASSPAHDIRTEFLANLSHELRTPLTQISGPLSLLEDAIYAKNFSEAAEYVALMNAGSLRLNHTITNLLKIAELENGLFSPRFEPIIIDELLSEEIARFEKQANEKSLTIVRPSIPAQTKIMGDRDALHSIIGELLSNACQYTDHGAITIAAAYTHQHLTLSITDGGQGMTAEQLRKACSPFVQVSTGYSRRYDGMGIGLALVHQYALINNISFHLSSIPHHGTTAELQFTVLSPDKHVTLDMLQKQHASSVFIPPQFTIYFSDGCMHYTAVHDFSTEHSSPSITVTQKTSAVDNSHLDGASYFFTNVLDILTQHLGGTPRKDSILFTGQGLQQKIILSPQHKPLTHHTLLLQYAKNFSDVYISLS